MVICDIEPVQKVQKESQTDIVGFFSSNLALNKSETQVNKSQVLEDTASLRRSLGKQRASPTRQSMTKSKTTFQIKSEVSVLGQQQFKFPSQHQNGQKTLQKHQTRHLGLEDTKS